MLDSIVDDKGLVIVCVTLLAMTSLVLLGTEGMALVHDALIGLFGVAVGKSLTK